MKSKDSMKKVDDEAKSYYKEKGPILIERLKGMVEELLIIIGEEVGDSLSADKKKAVVQGKMEAATAARQIMLQIDEYEREIYPERFGDSPAKPKQTSGNWAERFAQ